MLVLFLSLTSNALASTSGICHKGQLLSVGGGAIAPHLGHGDVLPGTWYLDTDGDGYGDPAAPTTACTQPAGTVSDSSDCDPDDPAIHPAAHERCNGIDDDCDGDTDGPTAIDATTWYTDADGDSYGDGADPEQACAQPAGTSPTAGDCDDSDNAVNPAALETCSDGDDDCDGLINEGDATDAGIWYSDEDGDGFGDVSVSVSACEAPTGFVPDATDCDDLEPASFPGNAEVCDLVDNDCDGDVDADAVDALPWYADDDGDGYGDASELVLECAAPPDYVADGQDCDDTDAATSPAGEERCDLTDNDCDAVVDEPDATDASTWYADLDHDGFGDPTNVAQACAQPADYVADAQDCDDDAATTSPLGLEVCDDGIDQDCSGVDLSCPTVCTTLLCDGEPGLVIGHPTDGASGATDSSVFRYDGAFTQQASLPTVGTQGTPEVADLDGDGYLDVVFPNYGTSAYSGEPSYIYWGSAAGYSAADRTSLFVAAAVDVVALDADHDGWLDLAFAAYSGPSKVYFGSAAGFSEGNVQALNYPITYGGFGSSYYAYQVEADDIDGDGVLDVLLNGFHGVWAFPSTLGGATVVTLTLSASTAGAITTGDFNGDGRVDLALGRFYANQVEIYAGDGLGGFGPTPLQVIPTSALSGPVSAGDYDGDGDLDLVTGANGAGVVHYTKWDDTAGAFAAAVSFSVSSEAAGASSVGDLDDDGYDDVALPLSGGGTLVYWGGVGGLSDLRTALVDAGKPSYGNTIVTTETVYGEASVEICVAGAPQWVRGATAGSYLDAGATWPGLWYVDADGDGFGAPGSGYTACDTPADGALTATDCDDADGAAYPGGIDVCDDGIDQDCAGGDEECPFVPLSGTGTPADATLDLDGTGVALYLGLPVTNVGDTNGDGIDDILVGAHGTGSKRGAALLYESPFSPTMTAADYQAMFNGVAGGTYGDEAGYYASQHGDVDGDGTIDLAVGAVAADLFALDGGATYIMSGADGYTGMGSVDLNTSSYARIGSSTAYGYMGAGSAVGDQDGDGDNELFVAGTYGMVMIEDLQPGDFDVDTDRGPGDRWLTAVRASRPISSFDFNGDGLDDVAVGTAASYFTSAGGYTALRTGPVSDGDLNSAPAAGDGWTVSTAAGQLVASDLDGDGYDDVVFGGDKVGSTSYIYAGNAAAAPTYVAHFVGNVDSAFGATKAAIGDLDEDGEQDLVFGADYDDTSGYERGAVYMFRGPFSGGYGVGDAAFTMLGDKSTNHLGTGLAAAGDVTGDGHLDFWIGASNYNELLLISGAAD